MESEIHEDSNTYSHRKTYPNRKPQDTVRGRKSSILEGGEHCRMVDSHLRETDSAHARV